MFALSKLNKFWSKWPPSGSMCMLNWLKISQYNIKDSNQVNCKCNTNSIVLFLTVTVQPDGWGTVDTETKPRSMKLKVVFFKPGVGQKVFFVVCLWKCHIAQGGKKCGREKIQINFFANRTGSKSCLQTDAVPSPCELLMQIWRGNTVFALCWVWQACYIHR